MFDIYEQGKRIRSSNSSKTQEFIEVTGISKLYCLTLISKISDLLKIQNS